LAAHVTSDAFTGAVATIVADNDTASREDNVTLYGLSARVSTYTSGATNDTWVLDTTMPGSFGSGVQVHIATQNNITAASVLTTALVGRAQAQLVVNRAPMFSDGYYVGVLSPLVSRDFKTDTTWVNAASYSNIEELYKGEVGRWFGSRIVETTQPYRETVAGVEADGTGAVYNNLFVGQEAFGHTELAGPNQRMIYVNQGPDKTDPLDMYSIFGWKQIVGNKALNANWAISIMTGAAA
jgi:N4-gp56 family major capsid protein